MTARDSRFTADVDPVAPWPEYPRPQLRRDEWTNLNGRWELAIIDVDAAEPGEFDREILVPYPIGSELSGVTHTLLPAERAWMRRTFSYDPAALDGRLLRLHFGGVDWDCTVWCNGVEVGRHQGAHDPWWVDITDALDPGGEQELVLSILDPTDDGLQPVGKQSLLPIFIWYPACAGVWQSVWLEPVPATCIERVVTTADLADERLTITVDATGADGDTVTVTVTAAGTPAGAGSAPVIDGRAIVDIVVAGLRPWHPDDPFLYDLAVDCGDDAVESYAGAREVGVTVDHEGIRRLTLNGEETFHLGMLDQGWWPDGLYTAPTDEALAFDIEAQKAMGFNTIRKHVKVEPARWYWHADRLGMLVWQDVPSTRVDKVAMKEAIDAHDGDLTQADFSVIAPADDPPGFRQELDAMLDALLPHPSIVVWVPFNEGWGQHDTAATLDHVADRDPSRLVNGPSGWVDDGEGRIRDHHMYHQEGEFPGVDPTRPVVYGEYGGYTLAVEGHRLDATVFGYGDTEDGAALAARYVELTETLIELRGRGLAGAIYTQTTDVEGEINGLLTYDRAVQKIPNEVLAPLHRRLIG